MMYPATTTTATTTAMQDSAVVESFGAAQSTIPRGLLPDGAACAELHSAPTKQPDLQYFQSLPVEEQALVDTAVDRRKADFGDSRWCAHQALKSFMDVQPPILRGPRGMPLFPDGIAGSLTHTEGFRAALLAPTHRWQSVGIDAEVARPLPEGVFSTIARPGEQRRIRNTMRSEDLQLLDTVLFSAKEATYKAWFPLTHRFLDFDQADIDLRADGTFTSYLLARPVPVPFIQGRWTIRNGYVITVTAVPAN